MAEVKVDKTKLRLRVLAKTGTACPGVEKWVLTQDPLTMASASDSIPVPAGVLSTHSHDAVAKLLEDTCPLENAHKFEMVEHASRVVRGSNDGEEQVYYVLDLPRIGKKNDNFDADELRNLIVGYGGPVAVFAGGLPTVNARLAAGLVTKKFAGITDYELAWLRIVSYAPKKAKSVAAGSVSRVVGRIRRGEIPPSDVRCVMWGLERCFRDFISVCGVRIDWLRTSSRADSVSRCLWLWGFYKEHTGRKYTGNQEVLNTAQRLVPYFRGALKKGGDPELVRFVHMLRGELRAASRARRAAVSRLKK